MLTQERTEYINVEEASIRAGVSSMTIRRALKSGALVYRMQRGIHKYLDAAEVDKWARERTEMRPIDGGA